MLLHRLFLFLLSFVYTFSSAQPVCENRVTTDAVIRNINGASGTYFRDNVAVSILQHYVSPSPTYPTGGVIVNVTNMYCFDVEITFRLESGNEYSFNIRRGRHNQHILIPELVLYAHEIRVSLVMDVFR
jgi:hypothetical protein